MYNQGQTCCASKRFIVQESIADRFLEKFQAALAGAPGDRWMRRRPKARCHKKLRWSICRQDRRRGGARRQGADGGKPGDRPGSFMETTILADVKPNNPAFEPIQRPSSDVLPGQG